MIDWDRVAELRRDIGEDAFSEVVALFLEEFEGVMGRIGTNSPDRNDAEDLHFLKGCALNLGFTSLSRLCRDEELIQKSHPDRPADRAGLELVYEKSKQLFFQNPNFGPR